MIGPPAHCAFLVPTPLMAQTPFADNDAGPYRMIGLDDAGRVDELLRIVAQDETLTVSVCRGWASLVLPLQSGVQHSITGTLRGVPVTCDPFNTYQAILLIACYGDGASVARPILWLADTFAEPLELRGLAHTGTINTPFGETVSNMSLRSHPRHQLPLYPT